MVYRVSEKTAVAKTIDDKRRTIIHIDFNSYFATVEQQANPRLRGKPIGVTGGDRMTRTVLGAASVEAKKLGVKTGMRIPEALKLCPNLILVRGDSDKYLECTKRFLNILKDYSPYLEVFSIDEAFLEISTTARGPASLVSRRASSLFSFAAATRRDPSSLSPLAPALLIAEQIKSRIRAEVGEWITCSIGISYNKLLAKLAGSLYKPDGLVVIADQKAAIMILDQIELDKVCGIGPRIKKRLNNMGVFNFRELRAAPLSCLLASFKSYGQILFNMARGIDHSPIVPFYEKEEVKSVGHRHTLNHDTSDTVEIKQVLYKLTELIARRLRSKKLLGKTVSLWYRDADFFGEGMQTTIIFTQDGLEIFDAAWRIFLNIWRRESIRMVGVSISNLKSKEPSNLSLLSETQRRDIITSAMDKVNDKFGEFTLQRGILLNSTKMYRKPNPYLSDRRFKL